MLVQFLAVTATVLIASLIAYALYVFFGWPKHDCAICAKPVRERRACEWCDSLGKMVYTHYGRCSELYTQQYVKDHYSGASADAWRNAVQTKAGSEEV